MAAAIKAERDGSALLLAIKTTQDLIDQFEASLKEGDADAAGSQEMPDSLSILETSAALSKAQTTKLALLIVNKPFSPAAITTVIRDLSSGILPMMIRGALAVTPPSWGRCFSKEVRSRVGRILRELRGLLHEVAHADPSLPSKEGSGRDSLASTGVVWAACDALIALKKLGLGGLLAQKALEQQEMLQDAISELDEWSKEPASPPASSSSSTSSVHSGDDGEHDLEPPSSTCDIDDLFAASNALPQNATKLRAQLVHSLKKLALIKMLYKAVSKRRLLILPSPPGRTVPPEKSEEGTVGFILSTAMLERIDRIMDNLVAISSETDELAQAFYDLDGQEAEKQLDICATLAKDVAQIVTKSWDGHEDEFSGWVSRWLEMLEG